MPTVACFRPRRVRGGNTEFADLDFLANVFCSAILETSGFPDYRTPDKIAEIV